MKLKIAQISIFIACAGLLTGCYSGTSSALPRGPVPGQGRYVYPLNLRPIPTQYAPQEDLCGLRLYGGLAGQHIGGIHLASIAVDKRIIAPAELEIDQDDFLEDMNELPPFVDVTDLVVGQPVYAASVRTGIYRGQIGPDREDRLTLELDREGYIQTLDCR